MKVNGDRGGRYLTLFYFFVELHFCIYTFFKISYANKMLTPEQMLPFKRRGGLLAP